jgi:hypothetical protein
MKNINSCALIALIINLLAINACSKKDITASDYPTLTITSPAQGESFIGGRNVRIAGSATVSQTDDAHLLHEIAVTVKSLPDSTTVFTAVYNAHDMRSLNIDTVFAPAVTATTNMVVTAQAENHLLKVTSQSVNFTLTH